MVARLTACARALHPTRVSHRVFCSRLPQAAEADPPTIDGAELRVQDYQMFPDYRGLAASLCGGPLIVATASTDSLRRLARLLCTRSDSVLEIGCSYGACSAILCEAVSCPVQRNPVIGFIVRA